MKSYSPQIGIAALITLVGACASQCSNAGTSGASGGSSGSAGSSSSGGSSGSGGFISSGGSSGSGGFISSGGSSGSGGSSSSSQPSSTGGSSGSGGDETGGSSQAGGSSGTAGAQASGGTAGTSSSSSFPGGSGGTHGSGGASAGGSGAGGAPTLDAGAGGSSGTADANPSDASATTDGSRWSDWNAFLPLASGSGSPGEPGTTPDISGHGYDAIYGFGVSFSDSSMVLSGSVGDVTISSRSYVPAINVTGSYTVSVWVSMSDATGYRTFVSADGTVVSGFYLQMRDTNRFAFTLSTSDSNEGVSQPCIAQSTDAAAAFTRYHLVATRDASSGTNKLYVNGKEAGSATCSASTGVGWAANTFAIGHGKYDGGNTDYVAGSLSNLGLLGRALGASEVAALYALGPG